MAAITYIAKRNVSPFHVVDNAYTFKIPLEGCDPTKRYNRVRHKSIAGQSETWLKSIQKSYSLRTIGMDETERERTNMLIYSSDLSQSAWQKTNLTITANSGIAPDGSNTAFFLNESATSTSHFILNAASIPGVANKLYTYSVYLKASTRPAAAILVQDTITGGYFWATFDLITGASLSRANSVNGVFVSMSSTPVGDGWFRCSITGYFTSIPGLRHFVYTLTTHNTLVTNYLGVVGQGILYGGSQLEASDKMTDYILTDSSAVTEIPLLAYMREFMDSVADGSTFQITFDTELGETSPTNYELGSDTYEESREGTFYKKVSFSAEEI